MPSFDINSFKSQFQNGAKSYLFYLYLDNPAGGNMEKTAYLVNTSSMPVGTIDPIETNWQGQVYSFGGTHTYEDWTVTFKVDAKAEIRKDMEAWQRLIHDPLTNQHGDPNEYMRNQRAVMIDGTGSPIKEVVLWYAWPTSVGEIALDYASKEIATFDVTFKYLYWV